MWDNNPQTAHSEDPLFHGSLPLVTICSSPLASVHPRFHPSSRTRHGPFGHSAFLSVSPPIILLHLHHHQCWFLLFPSTPVFLQVLQLWPWWKSVVITGRDLSKCKWWQVEAGREWAHRAPNEPCLQGPTKSIWWEGCRGFPEGKWSTGLMMSRYSISSPGSGWLGYSHWEDLMEIMAGFVAVILSSVLFFHLSPPRWNSRLCVASVTFSTSLFQPSVS